MSHSTLNLPACICVCSHVWEVYIDLQPQRQACVKKKCNAAEIIIKLASAGAQCGTVDTIASCSVK